MRRYHHVGIPTDISRPGEVHIPHLKIYVVPYELSDFGVEWIRFEQDAPYPDLVKSVPHVAFEVDDLEVAIAERKVLIKPNSPSPGVLVSIIEENGAPIEFLQFS